MRKQKGIATIGILLIVASIIVVLFAVGVPTAVGGWINAVVGIQNRCDIDPYNNMCICEPVGERRISVPWLGLPKWNCESLELLILDPESPTFEDDSLAFIDSYFAYYCSSIYNGMNCGSICEGGETNPVVCAADTDQYMTAAWGWDSSGNRLVNIECMKITQRDSQGRPVGGTSPWRMAFYVESATDTPTTVEPLVDKNYYYNEQLDKKCTMPSVCTYYDNPEWCIGTMQMTVVPAPLFSIMSIGSGYPAPR